MAESPSTYSSNIQIGLPGSTPENLIDPQVVTTYRILSGAILNLLRALEQYGGVTQKEETQWSFLTGVDTILLSNLTRFYTIAGEDIDRYQFVNIYDDGGVSKVRLATSYDGAAPLQAHGFANSGALTGERLEVMLQFGVVPVSGIVSGDELYLSNTPGAVSNTPDTIAGHLEQHIGVGIANDLAFISITMGSFIQH